jgi:hypothetical protein
MTLRWTAEEKRGWADVPEQEEEEVVVVGLARGRLDRKEEAKSSRAIDGPSYRDQFSPSYVEICDIDVGRVR